MNTSTVVGIKSWLKRSARCGVDKRQAITAVQSSRRRLGRSQTWWIPSQPASLFVVTFAQVRACMLTWALAQFTHVMSIIAGTLLRVKWRNTCRTLGSSRLKLSRLARLRLEELILVQLKLHEHYDTFMISYLLRQVGARYSTQHQL